MTRALKIFISSPSDVSDERELARDVIRRVEAKFSPRVRLLPILWESLPMTATSDFQSQIVHTADCDLLIVILWSRLGTQLPAKFARPDGTTPTGTELEYEEAQESFRKTGRPNIHVYFKISKMELLADGRSENLDAIKESLRQLEEVKEFKHRRFFDPVDGSFTGGFTEFRNATHFATRLEEHLIQVVAKLLGEDPLVRATPVWTSGSPYLGLAAFDREHARIFFGRDEAIADVGTHLRTQAAEGTPFVVVLGMSGSGKSSLVRAGVLPRFESVGYVEGFETWRQTVFRPSDQDRLWSGLATALVRDKALPALASLAGSAEKFARMLETNPAAATALVEAALRMIVLGSASGTGNERGGRTGLVLVLDQLEELFTAEAITDHDRARFADLIASLVRTGSVWVLATLRSDYYHRLQDLPAFLELKKPKGQYDLKPPTPDEIGEMIRQPAACAGIEMEEGVPTRLLEAMAREPQALPLLQFALWRLFEDSQDSRRMTVSAYEAMGGFKGALVSRADEVLASVVRDDPQAKETFWCVMRSLVHLGAGGTDAVTRRREKRRVLVTDSTAARVVDAFIESRLFTSDRGDGNEPVIAVAHEALLMHWPALQKWLGENRQLLEARERLRAQASTWEAEGRSPDRLQGAGKNLLEAEWVAEKLGEQLTMEEWSFVRAWRAKVNAEARAEKRRVRVALTVFGALTVVAVTLAITAVGMWKTSEVSRRKAQDEARRTEIRFRVARALQIASTTPARAVLDVVVAAAKNLEGGEPVMAEVRGACLTLAPVIRIGHRIEQGAHSWRTFSEKNQVMSVAFSPDGNTIAAGLNNNTIRLWNRNGTALGEPLKGHEDTVRSVAFRPDGKTIASGSADRTVRLWGLDGKPRGQPFQGHEDTVTCVAFSPDGNTIASASVDRTVRLWGLDGKPSGTPLRGHAQTVTCVAFSLNGKMIVSGSEDGTIRLWNPDGTPRGQPLTGHNDRVMGVAFSPDSRILASGSSDRTIQLWDTDGKPRGIIGVGHTSLVNSVAFSPDGQILVSGSADQTIRLWEPDGRACGLPIQGHGEAVTSVAFSPDGNTIASGSYDHTIRLWRTDWSTALETLCSGLKADPVFADQSDPDVELVRGFVLAHLSSVARKAKMAGKKPSPAASASPSLPQKARNRSEPGREKGNEPEGMVLIPAGAFLMGDPEVTEATPHRVWVDTFYMDRMAVTNRQYRAYVEASKRLDNGFGSLMQAFLGVPKKKGRVNPPQLADYSRFNGDEQPVVGVTWKEAKGYSEWAGKRLPTEAEREKAARGGLVGKVYPWGDENPRGRASYGQNDTGYPNRVGTFSANGYGLYDMAGNVLEWCSDWYGERYYQKSPSQNPQGPESGTARVIRGGSWLDGGFGLRCGNRGGDAPTVWSGTIGFRCVRSVR